MKKIIALSMALAMVFALCACGGGNSGNTSKEKKKDTVYKVGDTWEVGGQWKVTIDSAAATDERNEFDDTNPAQVVIINYTYENIGYEDSDGIMDGLFVDLESAQVVDSGGEMCQTYPAPSVTNYPKEAPVDSTCTAQAAFGVKTAGNSLTIHLTQYDGNGKKHKATFKIAY